MIVNSVKPRICMECGKPFDRPEGLMIDVCTECLNSPPKPEEWIEKNGLVVPR